MIVVEEESHLLLITQNDHAHFAWQLLSLWHTDGVPRHPRREQLMLAAREHDNGWREADAAPRLEPQRAAPYSFLTLPSPLRLEIWRRGTNRILEADPYVAALVFEHALQLHRAHNDEPAWQGFLTHLEERRARLLEESAVSELDLASDYRLIELTDLASLAACCRWSGSFSRAGVQGEASGGTLQLQPFPLAGPTTLRVPCRRIPRRPYSGDADLCCELASARWEEMAVRVAPGEGDVPASAQGDDP